MNFWFYINFATFLLTLLLFILSLPKTGSILVASVMGIIGLFFILFNWNMHAIFSKIRKLKSRNERIKIAKYARKIMPYHLTIGICGLLFVTGHSILEIYNYGISLHMKTLSGLLALTGLIIVTISGYLRRVKATRYRRFFHLYSSMILFVLVVIHIFS